MQDENGKVENGRPQEPLAAVAHPANLTLYLLGDLPEAEAGIVRTHLAACAACRVEARTLEQTIAVLRTAYAAAPSAPLQLDARHRRFKSRWYGPSFQLQLPRPPRRLWQNLLATAASLVLLLGTAWVFLLNQVTPFAKLSCEVAPSSHTAMIMLDRIEGAGSVDLPAAPAKPQDADGDRATTDLKVNNLLLRTSDSSGLPADPFAVIQDSAANTAATPPPSPAPSVKGWGTEISSGVFGGAAANGKPAEDGAKADSGLLAKSKPADAEVESANVAGYFALPKDALSSHAVIKRAVSPFSAEITVNTEELHVSGKNGGKDNYDKKPADNGDLLWRATLAKREKELSAREKLSQPTGGRYEDRRSNAEPMPSTPSSGGSGSVPTVLDRVSQSPRKQSVAPADFAGEHVSAYSDGITEPNAAAAAPEMPPVVTKSPLILKGLYANRGSGETRAAARRAYGGGGMQVDQGAGTASDPDARFADEPNDITVTMDANGPAGATVAGDLALSHKRRAIDEERKAEALDKGLAQLSDGRHGGRPSNGGNISPSPPSGGSGSVPTVIAGVKKQSAGKFKTAQLPPQPVNLPARQRITQPQGSLGRDLSEMTLDSFEIETVAKEVDQNQSRQAGESREGQQSIPQSISQFEPEGVAQAQPIPQAEPPAPPPPPFDLRDINGWMAAAQTPRSTFAMDVDTASYALCRNYLRRGVLPPAGFVRPEEFVNAFDYAYPPPTSEAFSIQAQGAPSPFRPGVHLLSLGVQGRRLGRENKPAMLTLVVDTSGSMALPDRLPLVKQALRMLIEGLQPADRVALVAFDAQPRLALEATPASDKKRLLAALDALQASGLTDLEAALRLGYATAARGFVPGAANRVLLLSDGVANLGAGAADEILASIERYRKQGLTLSVFGFGLGAFDDRMLATLAARGNGNYHYLDSADEARRVLVDDLTATLHTMAADAKIQVEFNPRRVTQYRQIGYEPRRLRDEDFRNDAIVAGEVGSGQSATCLYELRLDGDSREPVATVRVRYRDLESGRIVEIEQPVGAEAFAASADRAAPRFRLAACASEFAELLRGSPYVEGSAYADVARVLRPVAMELTLDRRVRELLQLVTAAPGCARVEE